MHAVTKKGTPVTSPPTQTTPDFRPRQGFASTLESVHRLSAWRILPDYDNLASSVHRTSDTRRRRLFQPSNTVVRRSAFVVENPTSRVRSQESDSFSS